MSNVRWDFANATRIGFSTVTISTATTTSFSLGSPADLNLAAVSGYTPGDRVVAVITASTAGTTDSITWVIQDAPDSSGSIGTTATAVTSAVFGGLSAGTGVDGSMFGIQVQPNRPWMRFRVTSSGATDTFVCHLSVWAIPNNA